jgi:hypothetical protein
MTRLVFFLEELSAEEMLRSFLPRVLSLEIAEHVRYHRFQGKQDLHKELGRKLRGYQIAKHEKTKFIVLRDKDSADCQKVKADLVKIAREAGKPETVVRIACTELESWYLADLAAVGQAYGLENLHLEQDKRKFRNPDNHASPAEELKKLTQNRYQKIDGSRRIGKHLNPHNTRSTSFKNFVLAVTKNL